jgi:hypothetical protein
MWSQIVAMAAVAAALCGAPGAQAAGAVFKCQAAGGKLTFSDQPCPNEQKQETVKAAPPPGYVDVDSVCGPAARPAEYYRKASVCQRMRSCAENKGGPDCEVYCEPQWDGMRLPGVKFGLTSPSCLRYNDRIGGKTWVQTQRRHPSGQGYDLLPASCVEASGQLTRQVFVGCLPGTTNCSSTLPQRGRRLVAQPLEEVMAKACGA